MRPPALTPPFSLNSSTRIKIERMIPVIITRLFSTLALPCLCALIAVALPISPACAASLGETVTESLGLRADAPQRLLRWEAAGQVRVAAWEAMLAHGQMRQAATALQAARSLEATVANPGSEHPICRPLRPDRQREIAAQARCVRRQRSSASPTWNRSAIATRNAQMQFDHETKASARDFAPGHEPQEIDSNGIDRSADIRSPVV
jgi:hypothetical protein